MGVSTNASISFGIDCGEDHPLTKVEYDGDGDRIYNDDAEELELDEFLAKKAGLADPYDELPKDYDDLPYEEYRKRIEEIPDFSRKREAYWDAKSKLEKACPVEIHHHCSGDYPMYVLAVRGTETSASRGEAVPVAEYAVGPVPLEKIQAARDFCAEHGLQEFKDPQWLLYSFWG